jgi:hypothetical protein
MEAAYDDLGTGFPERPCNIERSGVLVRPHTDERNHAKTSMPAKAGEKRRTSTYVFVSSMTVLSILTSGPSTRRSAQFGCDAVQGLSTSNR